MTLEPEMTVTHTTSTNAILTAKRNHKGAIETDVDESGCIATKGSKYVVNWAGDGYPGEQAEDVVAELMTEASGKKITPDDVRALWAKLA